MRKTVLMDLQGTLGGDPIGDISSFEFYPRTIEALKLLSDNSCRLIVITNQSRISKGFLSKEIYNLKVSELNSIVNRCGINDLEFYCCPHTTEEKCDCKKPKTRLFDSANAKEEINIDNCFMVGDMGKSDMVFAHNLGIRKILVLTGVGESSLNEYRPTWEITKPDYIATDFYNAVEWILNN